MNDAMLERLVSGAEQLNISLATEQAAKLLDYLALLAKWNKAFNLTAIRDIEKMLPLHLLDSLAVAGLLNGNRIADIGTGAGIPGIPLAILHPEKEFLLVDSNIKKTRFVTQASLELGLSNVRVEHSRVELVEKGTGFTTVITRAFATLDKIIELSGHLLDSHGRILAMKSQAVNEEVRSLPQGWRVKYNHELIVPGVEGYRCLVELDRGAD